MKTHDYVQDDVLATLALALGLWAGAVAAGTHAGVFARLPAEVLAALATFATAFAVAAVTVDARLRAWSERRATVAGRLAILGLAVVAATTLATYATTMPAAGLASALPVPVYLFVMPVTAALAVAAIRASGRAFSSPAGKAPVRRPAAT